MVSSRVICGCRKTPAWSSCDPAHPVLYIVASAVMVHFVYGDLEALDTLLSVARCVTPTSCPLEGIAVRKTGLEVALGSTISVMALLLFHENAIRRVVADPGLRRIGEGAAPFERVGSRLRHDVGGNTHPERRGRIEPAGLELYVGNRIFGEGGVPGPRVDRRRHVGSINERRGRGNPGTMDVEDG